MKNYTPNSPNDGFEEELSTRPATPKKHEDSQYDGYEEELPTRPATPKKHGNFSELARPQREIVVEDTLDDGITALGDNIANTYISFMKALALTLANIIMITVIIFAIRAYFAVKAGLGELHETFNQF